MCIKTRGTTFSQNSQHQDIRQSFFCWKETETKSGQKKCVHSVCYRESGILHLQHNPEGIRLEPLEMVWGRAKLSDFQVKPGKEEDSGQNISSALRAAQNNKFSEIALALSQSQ